MQSRHLKERQAGAAFWYLLRFHIGQQSDNIEHHLWFLSIPAFCQIIVDYSSLYHILVSNWKFHQNSTLYVPSSVFKPFSNPTGLIRPKHWAPHPLLVVQKFLLKPSLLPLEMEDAIHFHALRILCVPSSMWSSPLEFHRLEAESGQASEHVTRGLPSFF